jgi:hypothetical protein
MPRGVPATHPDQHVTGLRDRRIREHPLDIALRERGDVADGHRQTAST